MAKLNKKVKEYLLEESKGRVFPTTPMPHFSAFSREVTEGMQWYKRQKLILKTVINAMDLFPPIGLTIEEKNDLGLLIANGRNPVGDAKYAQAVVRRHRKSYTPLYVMIIAGRGAGKSTMAGLIVAYLIRFLVWLQNPHKFFGLGRFKPISIQMLAGKEGQAISLFQIAKSMVRGCTDLRGTYDELQSIMDFGGIIRAEAYTTNADSVRGADTILYYHEECAFCGENTPESMKSFTQVEKAIRPAVLNRFQQNGTILLVTSAGAKQGKTYSIYKDIKSGKIKNAVLFQLAAWEIGNPKFPTKDSFEEDYLIDPVTAEAEQGAQFVDTKNTFLTEAEVLGPLSTGRTKQEKGIPGIQYQVHLDPSRKHDRYGLSLGHKEYRVINGIEKIVGVIDYITYWEPQYYDAEGERKVGLTTKQKAVLMARGGMCVEVNPQTVMQHIEKLCEVFNIMRVTSDQFDASWIMTELQERYGTEEYEFAVVETITEMSNWMAYRNLKKMINTRSLEYYEEKPLLDELRVLMRYNKNKPLESSSVYQDLDEEDEDPNEPRLIYSVEAPKTGPVRTDDLADSVAFNLLHMMNNMDLAPARIHGSLVSEEKRKVTEMLNNPDVHSPMTGLDEVWQ